VVVLKKGGPAQGIVKHVKKTGDTLYKRNQYYENNKEAIIYDLFAMGRYATRDKWGIPKGTLVHLEYRWLTREQRHKLTTEEPINPPQFPASRPPSENGHLPHFPQFSDSWDPAVQLKWLEVYQNLDARQTAQTNT